jgi:hypothetical protein
MEQTIHREILNKTTINAIFGLRFNSVPTNYTPNYLPMYKYPWRLYFNSGHVTVRLMNFNAHHITPMISQDMWNRTWHDCSVLLRWAGEASGIWWSKQRDRFFQAAIETITSFSRVQQSRASGSKPGLTILQPKRSDHFNSWLTSSVIPWLRYLNMGHRYGRPHAPKARIQFTRRWPSMLDGTLNTEVHTSTFYTQGSLAQKGTHLTAFGSRQPRSARIQSLPRS